MRYALGLQGAQFSHRGLPGDEEGLQNRTSYIFLDGITFPREWYRAIKYRIDSGDLENDVLVLTGSWSMFIRGEVESFPGRRGKGRDVIFHPLSFREFLKVMNPDIYSSLEVIKGLNPAEIWEKCTRARPWLDEVNRAFESYLECSRISLKCGFISDSLS